MRPWVACLVGGSAAGILLGAMALGVLLGAVPNAVVLGLVAAALLGGAALVPARGRRGRSGEGAPDVPVHPRPAVAAPGVELRSASASTSSGRAALATRTSQGPL